MGFTINGTGTARPSGTSHSVGVSAATAGDYEFVVLLSEDPIGVWTDEITPPLDYVAVSVDNWALTLDGVSVYTAIYAHISDGDTSSHDFVTDDSQRLAMVRCTLTGSSGSDIERVLSSQDLDVDNAAGALCVAQAPLSWFGNGTDPCDSILVLVADKTWADPGGFGASALIGDDDTSSQTIDTIRCTNFQLGVWLIPEGDDPFQVGWTGPV